MTKRLTISGSTLRARDSAFKAALTADILKNVWPILEKGDFKPVIFARFPLSKADSAHRLMESGKHTGKIVLTNNW